MRHFDQLSHNSIKTHHSSIRLPTFLDIVTN